MQSTSSRYKLFLLAISPLALAHVVYRACKDGGWRYFQQRLGFSHPEYASRPIHFHCASVGEFITAKPLIQAIKEHYPDKSIAISTNTPTAASLVNKLEDEITTHHYLPLDLAFTSKRFLSNVNPICAIILETEIWPTFYATAAKNNIPIIITNARLTNKTLETNPLIRNEYANALKNVRLVLGRSNEDCKKYISLGAAADKTHTIGNLKYSISNANNTQLACTTIKRPFFLAASTHEGEESQLSDHVELLKRKNYLLILAPRYPDRCKQLAQQFKSRGLKVAMRSTQNEVANDADIYIVDTLGELNTFFNEAALVFIGGTLIPRGGHNILEPANFGKCIIVGPHTDNFSLETNELKQAKALVQVKNNHELGLKLIALLKDDEQREQYGKNAANFMDNQSNILEKYLDHISTIINMVQ